MLDDYSIVISCFDTSVLLLFSSCSSFSVTSVSFVLAGRSRASISLSSLCNLVNALFTLGFSANFLHSASLALRAS